jgi:hypothetical protein
MQPQEKKIRKIAGFTDNHNVEVAKSLIDIEDKINVLLEKTEVEKEDDEIEVTLNIV